MSSRNWQGGLKKAYESFKEDIKQDKDYIEFKQRAKLGGYGAVFVGRAYTYQICKNSRDGASIIKELVPVKKV